jgi:diguanylate cyclase (GGDEF)-like protein
VPDPKLHDENARLAALQRYEVLDTPQEEGFDRITRLVQMILDVPMCAISLLDTDRQWFKSCVGLPAKETARDISFCTYTIQDHEPFLIPDAHLDPRFAQNPLVTNPPFIRSYIGIPLATPDGYNIGSLCAIDVRPRNFSPDQIAILKNFAALVVDELELRRIAQTDHLTGAATRRSFTLEMEKTLARHKRKPHPAALLLMDIDHFKRVNDTYGHPAGDLVLRKVVEVLSLDLRQSDTVGRLGGEEFGVLLQDSELPEAFEAAERLRARLEATVVEHDPPLRVTASFGVAALDAHWSSVEQWLYAADQALYQAKADGRNRCCVAETAKAASC